MRTVRQATALLSFALLLGGANPVAAQFYLQTNLVSDLTTVGAVLQDDSLVNPWGLVAAPITAQSPQGSPWWVSNNGTATSTLYNTSAGVAKVNLASGLPCGCINVPGDPTGVVFNGGTGFVVSKGGASGPARFIFASEDGSISGWNPTVPPPPPPVPPHVSSEAIAAVPASDANVYKGIAIASTINGDFLYASNFRAGTVDMFDHNFKKLPGTFADPTIPAGYAPFGIQNIGGIIYVTYAKQDATKHDDVPGVGHGFVNAFTTDGTLIRRVASRETLNSPWGLAMAPAGFGKFSGDLLVGNFGDGKIHAYDPNALRGNGEFKRRGVLHSAGGPPLKIDGLWALQFGNGGNAGPKTTLFFTAGLQGESHGLFGKLDVTTPPKDDQGDNDQADNDQGDD